MLKKILYFQILLSILFFFVNIKHVYAETDNNIAGIESNIDIDRINTLVEKMKAKTKIPGISIVIVNHNQTIYLNHGYADKENKIETERTTVFELGSVSKAYTATAVIKLVQEGKLSLADPVSKYLPWFMVHFYGKYDGRQVDSDVELTIANLLYHTSGIPFNTIGYIPEGDTDDMLEKTVKNLIGVNIDSYPGDKFQYASVNYDILGLIIQEISRITFEQYIKMHVLESLGLDHTYVLRSDISSSKSIATGYKINFFQPVKYDAPVYRGNTPAGYILSDSEGMARWMKIQMGLIDVSEEFKEIIDMTHIPDATVASAGDYLYAGGWEVSIKGDRIQHSGGNPNYSSKVIMYPDSKIGICVLANLNSNVTEYLADNIMNIIQGKETTKYSADEYKTLDSIFSIVFIGAVIIGTLYLVLLGRALGELIAGKRTKIKMQNEKVANMVLVIPLVIFMGYCIYYLPNILMRRVPWNAVNVWGSVSIMRGCILGFIMLVIFMMYVVATFTYTKEKEINYMALIPLGLMNGISSSLIIFTINESFNRELKYSKELLIYFIFSIICFVYTTKLMQGRMIVITNELAYEKRISMINNIMSSSYQSIERIGYERIYSGLNNDCAEVAKMPEIVVGFVSNLLTVLFCLGYLLTKSVITLIASLSVIVINCIISYITSKKAEKYWIMNREIQDIYYGQMSDLVNGFKELVLNKSRRNEFWKDMNKYSRLSTDMNKKVSIKYLNYHLYSTTVYNMIFGVIVFLFPLFIANIDINLLRDNLFIVFYLIGPFNGVTDTIPHMRQLKVNMDKIDKLIIDLEQSSNKELLLTEGKAEKELVKKTDPVIIEIKNLIYKYRVFDDIKQDEFVLGPLSVSFRSNQITFIIGGNGSGKSTFGKLITGLYVSNEGEILVNDKQVTIYELNDLFSSVYSDFNLFKKLYGIDYIEQKEYINELLEQMELDNKVNIKENGEFNTLKLSTGQRKRLAFIISCLEDKPMMIFDEWAAEQDPRFREYFYTKLLPSLKGIGKGVIVITHDDRYFALADQIIKLEHGKMVKVNKKLTY